MRCHKPPSTEGKLRNSDAQAGSHADAKWGGFVISNMTEEEAGTHSSLLLLLKNPQILNGSKNFFFLTVLQRILLPMTGGREQKASDTVFG